MLIKDIVNWATKDLFAVCNWQNEDTEELYNTAVANYSKKITFLLISICYY